MKIATGTKKKKDIIVIIEKRVMLSKDSCERIKYRLCANSTKKKKKRERTAAKHSMTDQLHATVAKYYFVTIKK
jgi:hypothetical protein